MFHNRIFDESGLQEKNGPINEKQETLLRKGSKVKTSSGQKAKKAVQEILDPAGIRINGSNAWDPRVHHPHFYNRLLAGGSLALGESYMDGWWDCPHLDQFFAKIFENDLDRKVKIPVWMILKAKLINAQAGSRAFVVGEQHYDIGNDIFSNMLDSQMNYSCGYWKAADTLEDAQNAKLELICRKMDLKKGMNVLDIGCGWGAFARYAARHYDARVLGITVSKQQAAYAERVCRDLPVEISLKDYRQLEGTFDRIVSVGMFEHVGYKNYRTYMESAARLLEPDGRFLLHTIGGNASVSATDPWIDKYIFPNSMLPSAKQITDAAEGVFIMEDWHNFGPDYDDTLMAWYENFTNNWEAIRHKYNQRFYRMWCYYLLACAGGFRSRRHQLWQIVFSKSGLKKKTHSLRDM